MKLSITLMKSEKGAQALIYKNIDIEDIAAAAASHHRRRRRRRHHHHHHHHHQIFVYSKYKMTRPHHAYKVT